METPLQGVVKNKPGSSKTVTGIGRSQSLKLHLNRSTPGAGRSHAEPKDLGPDVGKKYELSRKEETSQDEPHHWKSDKDTASLCEEP